MLEIPQGCRFQARCDRVHDKCTQVETKLRQIEPNRYSNCHLYGEPIAQTKI
ncbi:(GlcNAc)2 ABC transporter ATP-binding component 1 [Vibrio ponticus]|nr:(GlcNAc)2 ABC transporter ATP-binding component 1 [Vibrio ponticus]